MHPAPSIILFTVLSGLGFGLLACLALGLPGLSGWMAFFGWGIGYVLATGGLAASAFHLGNPQRALLAFTQWRSSWLSREAWASVLALLVMAPCALADWLGFDWPVALRLLAAVLALLTVLATSMIYASIRAVPRWNHWTTPALFLGFALAGGALLGLQGGLAAVLLLGLGAVQIAAFGLGDRQFAARGASMESATGLTGRGAVSVFEQPHTGGNYLTREMIHVVGRRHAQKLRVIAVVCASLLPAGLVLTGGGAGLVLAIPLHMTGALAARWLFFAEAEHVVGLYYGRRG
ncbi:dimethyl sulfoxide reductase anchor subunit family protein [Szabonella alba]|uniref:Dimethyl sulfoxide reductase anchor subunit n=1 Tax=Szabonella alba TaxID=2804194 RepID=A0A8K0VAL2_9RHOB|nr:DmsC/YnfH family molybdoenzyme membrane anchor subunit [Szabonella alba]MBL4918161.1 dimethyl sulfoxide reductase anchor subunit [Szabonella alba]